MGIESVNNRMEMEDECSVFPFSDVSALNSISVRHGLLYRNYHEGFQRQIRKNKDSGVFYLKIQSLDTQCNVHSAAYSISFITAEKCLLYYWSVSCQEPSQTCHVYFLTGECNHPYKICKKMGFRQVNLLKIAKISIVY